MIIVIIAGGSGTRLWPLSQSDYPKHLLKLTNEKSLLQNTVERATQLTDTIFVVTEQSHAPEVAAQLPQFPENHIIVEPARRGTASCFALALATIDSLVGGDEPVVFLHADAHIRNQEVFAASVTAAATASVEQHKITLVGVTPTYAATGFGYIEMSTLVGEGLYEIAQFKEKPDAKTAEAFIASGKYLWNMGLFAAPPSVFRDSFRKNAPELESAYETLRKTITDYSELTKTYLALKTIPIEYALMEKDPNLLVVPGTFDWADIGSFFDLHRILQDQDRNTIKGDVELIESEDVMVHSTGERPVVIIGLEGVVVVDSPAGLLVCAKDKAQLVGEAAKKLAKRNAPQ